MYCVYMSEEYLSEESARELYGKYIDENYNWRPSAAEESTTQQPAFLRDDGDADVDLLTGEGSEN